MASSDVSPGAPSRDAATSSTACSTRQPAQLTLLDLPAVRGYFWERFPQPYAGVDEAGRGCLAGPVVAAAVIFPAALKAHAPRTAASQPARTKAGAAKAFHLPGLEGLADSKQVPPEERALLAAAVKRAALAWALGVAWPREIERINILRASLLAMQRALTRLAHAPAFVAVDGDKPVESLIPQQTFVNGDARVPAIAAASILAKTWRDRVMVAMDRRHPGYGFAAHKGYAVKAHYEALRALGPCPQHRRTFRGVDPEYHALMKRGGEQCSLLAERPEDAPPDDG